LYDQNSIYGQTHIYQDPHKKLLKHYDGNHYGIDVLTPAENRASHVALSGLYCSKKTTEISSLFKSSSK